MQVADLQRLAADAARRAFELSSGVDGADALTASVEADIARIASHLEPGAPQWEALAAAGGVPADELRRRTAAWTLGGPDGVEVVAHPSELSPEQLARGGAALPGARATREAITADGRQLRVDSDGRWWSFAHSDELGWVVVGGPASTGWSSRCRRMSAARSPAVW